MRTTTARQLVNALYAACAGNGKVDWVVRYKYEKAGAEYKTAPMTYREACARAKAIQETFGYANVERKGK